MNERIRELAHEAGLPTYNPDGIPTKLEKFAELIVRECCQLIDDSTPVYSPDDLQEDYYMGKLVGYQSALLDIKQHFGVEE